MCEYKCRILCIIKGRNGASQYLAVIAKLNKANGKTSPLIEKQLKSNRNRKAKLKKAKKINNFWISSCCLAFRQKIRTQNKVSNENKLNF